MGALLIPSPLSDLVRRPVKVMLDPISAATWEFVDNVKMVLNPDGSVNCTYSVSVPCDDVAVIEYQPIGNVLVASLGNLNNATE